MARGRERLERAIEYQRAALAAMPRHPVPSAALRADLLNLTKVYQALNQPAEASRTAQELVVAGTEKLVRSLRRRLCPGSERPAHTRRGNGKRSAAEAVQMLKQAIAAGWNDAGKTSRDPDLASLRDRDDFRRLVAELFDRGFPADPFVP